MADTKRIFQPGGHCLHDALKTQLTPVTRSGDCTKENGRARSAGH